MTGTLACLARSAITAAAAPSTASSTSTLAPLVRAASACDCCWVASWLALLYRIWQSEQICCSLAWGSSRAIFLPPLDWGEVGAAMVWLTAPAVGLAAAAGEAAGLAAGDGEA